MQFVKIQKTGLLQILPASVNFFEMLLTKCKRSFIMQKVNGRLYLEVIIMKTTKEEIIRISLKLFAERGFDAVSTSMIAEQLGITKGALYRHFENKQAIFDAIWNRMLKLDAERANEDSVPEKQYAEDEDSYRNTNPQDLCKFVNNQFIFWTEHPLSLIHI